MGKSKSEKAVAAAAATASRSSGGSSWFGAKKRRKLTTWLLWILGPLLAAGAIAFLGAPPPEDTSKTARRGATSPRAPRTQVPVDEDSLEGGGDSSSSEPPPMDTWAKPEECQAWAGSGQCKENPGFMLVNCAFSCAKLTYARARYEKRCPKPEGHVAALAPGLMNATFSRVMSDFPELEPELLSEDPPVVLFHKFFRPSETDAFVRHGKGRYSKSLGVGMKADGTMGDVKTEIRTSSHGWCQHHECLQDPEVRRVIKRVADVTLTPENNAEYAQLVYYHACNSATDNNCAFYRQHNDFIDSDEFKLQGPRIYTLFGYMNDVPEGGGTRFTSLPSGPLTIQPQRGKAILWPSVLAMEPFSKDSRTDHEALPVTSGEKFGANFWIHQHDFKTPHTSGCTHEK